MTANMSAATPVLLGSTRLSIAAVATAASMALTPSRMICRPACAASGWLVVTMPCGAITSARLCAAQPSARSPRTAAQAAALGAASQVDSCGPDCGQEGEAPAAKAIAATNEYVPILKFIMTSSRLRQCRMRIFCGTKFLRETEGYLNSACGATADAEARSDLGAKVAGEPPIEGLPASTQTAVTRAVGKIPGIREQPGSPRRCNHADVVTV